MSEFFEKRRIVVTGGAGFLGRFVTAGCKKEAAKTY